MTWNFPRICKDNRKTLHRTASYHHLKKSKKKSGVVNHHYRRLCGCIIFLTLLAGCSIFTLIYLSNIQTDDDDTTNNIRFIQSFCLRYNTLCFGDTGRQSQFESPFHPIANNNNNHHPAAILEHQALSYPVSHIKYGTIIHNSSWTSLPVHGVLYMAVQNEDLQKVRESMRSIEDRFNHRWHYPWVLLCAERLTEDFIKYTSSISSGPIYYGKMDPEAFSYPYWINLDRVKKNLENTNSEQDVSALQMKRYQSGLFYHHSLFQNVKYIWRIEPGTTFSCQMTDNGEDPFEKMAKNNKSIGFAVTRRYQEEKAIKDIWKITKNYMDINNQTIYQALFKHQTIMPAMVDRHGYNSCHFWSLFEIMDMDFLKSAKYQHFFAYMDHQGTFFYEKLTDSLFRTMAVAMFLNTDRIEFFNGIGLKREGSISHCPLNIEQINKCACDTRGNDVFDIGSCSIRLLRFIDPLSILDTAKFIMMKMENKH